MGTKKSRETVGHDPNDTAVPGDSKNDTITPEVTENSHVALNVRFESKKTSKGTVRSNDENTTSRVENKPHGSKQYGRRLPPKHRLP